MMSKRCPSIKLIDDEAVWHETLFSKCGKWMDGWESRRRREEGHDWCIVKLGLPGKIKALDVDTRHFTGNFCPKVSIFGINMSSESVSFKFSYLLPCKYNVFLPFCIFFL